MHKAHNMSQTNLSIPISIEHRANAYTLKPAPKELADAHSETEVFIHELGTEDMVRGPFDAWQLREDFISWPRDRWKDFIDKTGKFDRPIVTGELFAHWQLKLREALILPAREWKTLVSKNELESGISPLFSLRKLQISWDGATPRLFIRSFATLDVIIATIQIDKLRGAEFKVCARHDCKSAPFRVEARQKIYCSNDCAHLVAVRNSRKRAQENAERKRR